MLMLVIRLVSHLVVQPRLAIIAATLGAAASDIAHLVLGPYLFSVIMLGSAVCLNFFWVHVGSAVQCCAVL
jgi:hypothetical protein